jgi:type VI secretion system protein ImpC
VRDIAAAHSGHRFRLWNALREAEDARYLGLCLPRFLGRLPYRVRTEPFAPLRYDESRRAARGPPVDPRLVRVRGPGRGFFRALSVVCTYPRLAVERHGRGITALRVPVYARVAGPVRGRGAVDLPAGAGAVAGRLYWPRLRRNDQTPAVPFGPFGAASEPQRGAPRSRDAAPYVFLVSRLAHYLKLIQREQLGRWKTAADLERELSGWLRRYVSAMPDPSPDVRARRPLRDARVRVQAVEGAVGWLRCHLMLQPHLTHNNAAFTLSLVSRLETSAEAL